MKSSPIGSQLNLDNKLS